mgnify:CR=1
MRQKAWWIMHDQKYTIETLPSTDRIGLIPEMIDALIDCYSILKGKKKMNPFEELALSKTVNVLDKLGY